MSIIPKIKSSQYVCKQDSTSKSNQENKIRVKQRDRDIIDDTQINSTLKAMETCEITIKKKYSIKNTEALSPTP